MLCMPRNHFTKHFYFFSGLDMIMPKLISQNLHFWMKYGLVRWYLGCLWKLVWIFMIAMTAKKLLVLRLDAFGVLPQEDAIQAETKDGKMINIICQIMTKDGTSHVRTNQLILLWKIILIKEKPITKNSIGTCTQIEPFFNEKITFITISKVRSIPHTPIGIFYIRAQRVDFYFFAKMTRKTHK